MDATTQEHWAKQVGGAWWNGDEELLRQLCREYEVVVDPDDPLRVTINAAPTFMQSDRIEFEVVKV